MRSLLTRKSFEALLFGLILLFCAAFAHAQGLRWDLGAPGSAGAVTAASTGGLPALLAQPGVTLNWCNYPVNAVPCTNFATTYTSLTLATPCANNTQVVLQGSSTCQATGDNLGNLGVYTAPNTSCAGLTCYAYTLTVNGFSSGPYLWMPPPSGLPDPGSNGILYRDAPNHLRIAVSADVIALFAGTCSISAYLRGDGSCAAFAFPALQGGTNTGQSFVVGNGSSFSFISGSSLNIDNGASLALAAGGVMNLASGTPTTALILPKAAGAAPTASGVFAFDITALQPVFGNGSATQKLIPLSGSTPTNGDCSSFVVSGTSVSVADTTSQPCLTTASIIPAVLGSSITLLGSDVPVSASTVTTVLTKAVTMPSSGCPCRAFVSYGLSANTGVALAADTWVNDGTNNFDTAGNNTTGSVDSGATFKFSGGGYSTGTYANSASITFTLKIESSDSLTVQAASEFSPQHSWMNVAISPSN